MPLTFERRSLDLTPLQWECLEALAAQYATVAKSGPRAGQPSWRTLIHAIACGHIDLAATTTPLKELSHAPN